jgi:hypothetical protein
LFKNTINGGVILTRVSTVIILATEDTIIIQVIIDIPKLNGGDSMVILPITIGTIPQGHKAVPEENASGASNIQGISYLRCIHVQCI